MLSWIRASLWILSELGASAKPQYQTYSTTENLSVKQFSLLCRRQFVLSLNLELFQMQISLHCK